MASIDPASASHTTAQEPSSNINLVVEFTYVPSQPHSHRPYSSSSLPIPHRSPYLNLPANKSQSHSGGLELLFDNVSKHRVCLPDKNAQGSPSTVGDLVVWLVDNLLKDPRKELFVLDGGV